MSVIIDRHEIYLKFASCDHKYKEYLETGNTATEPFLLAEPFGPWDITDAHKMENIIRIFVSLTIIGNIATTG